ncbi:oxidoreductase [Rhodococcus sp. SC4]|nr:oxidoreductase [Rhodococcus sp. SC4]
MTTNPERIVVAGAGVAGLRVCERLRKQGYRGALILLSSEDHQPYDRPPLSKDVLTGAKDDSSLAVDLEALDIDLRLGAAATGLDVAQRIVQIDTCDGAQTVHFDALVIATGSSPIRLPGSDTQMVLRTIDDARKLRNKLRPGQRLAVIGASWIGAEVATAAAGLGVAVTCIEGGSVPALGALGEEVGSRLLSWWNDVDLRLNSSVAHVTDHGVRLSDGEHIAADTVVIGVGVRPNTDWLDGSGIDIDSGIVVDAHLRAQISGKPLDNIVAVGDVAAWWSHRSGTRMRLGHWDDAVSGAVTAAATLLAGGPELPIHDPVPYFWSDQFGHKLQYVGHHTRSDSVVFREPDSGPGWSACWIDESGILTAVLAVDRPKDMVFGRKAIEASRVVDPDRIRDAAVAIG